MKTNFFKTISIAVLTIAYVLTSSITVFAQKTSSASNSLDDYNRVLDEFNKEYVTSYCFITEHISSEELSDSMTDFFLSMNIDEFRKYLYDAHINNIETESTSVDLSYNNEISTRAYTNSQKYYYNGDSNYIFINSTIYTADGYERYHSIDGVGYQLYTYPSFMPKGYETVISADRRKVDCSFNCIRMISAYVASTYSRMYYVTFTAGGGDVIGSSQI